MTFWKKKSHSWSSPPSRGFLSEKSIFMDGLGERVFTLLKSVNHFDWTFCQASSGQGAYTRTHFESDPSSSRQRDSHCGRREQRKERWVTPRGIPARKQVFLSHVRSCLIDSPSIIQSRKQSQRPLKKADFSFQILSWTVKKPKGPKERIKGRRKRPGAGATTTELTDYGAIPIPPTSLSFFQNRSNRTSGHWGEEWFGSKQLLSLRPSFDLS